MILNQEMLKSSDQFLDKILKIWESLANKLPWATTVDYQKSITQVKEVFWNCKKHKKLLVLWIWWSALWASSVLSALWKSANVIVLDTLDPEYCDDLFNEIDFNETLVNVISKSWSTLETLAQLSVVVKVLESKNLNIKDRMVVTTWSKWDLRDFANENDLLTLDVPDSAGWRFSVFTQVWLFPLLFAWVDTDQFVLWMTNAIEKFKTWDFGINVPMKLAASQIYAYENQKKNISVLMTYNKNLYWLLDWYRQLLAESIWKSEGVWITPVLALWSTDQHSQLQLYLEGPKDKFFTFVNWWKGLWPVTWDDFKYLHSKSFREIQNSFFVWTKKAFSHHQIEYQEIEVDINEKSIAEFLANYMICIWIMWEYFWINPYNQPAVEYWKIESKKILSEE